MGGDGTLGTIINEFNDYGIIKENMSKILFSLLPFGTGNDTARVFGWGSKEISI